MSREYELVLVFRQENEEKQQSLEAGVRTVLTENEMEIKAEKSLGNRKFYHPIDKHTMGKYLICQISGQGSVVEKLSGIFKLNQDILRFQFIRMV